MASVLIALIRLFLAPFILAAFLVAAIILVTYGGIGWIFTGQARITLGWPDFS
jgi:hypothetical protein